MHGEELSLTGLRLYNVFIGHSWKYEYEYERFVNLLDNADNFIWRNYSVPEYESKPTTTDRELINALSNQIKPVSVAIILAGMYVAYSDWIQIEIDISTRLHKPIIGVYPWGSLKMPSTVYDAAKEIIGWNTNSIVQAIKRCSV